MDDIIICRCEEITMSEIYRALEAGCRTVKSVKRYTRAGMGACQGRTCGNMIAAIIAKHFGTEPQDAGADVVRFPTVPLPLDVIGSIGKAGREGERE